MKLIEFGQNLKRTAIAPLVRVAVAILLFIGPTDSIMLLAEVSSFEGEL